MGEAVSFELQILVADDLGLLQIRIDGRVLRRRECRRPGVGAGGQLRNAQGRNRLGEVSAPPLVAVIGHGESTLTRRTPRNLRRIPALA
jgi:hypothetical protein